MDDSSLLSNESREVSISNEVLRKSYIQATETSFKPKWRSVLTWVDSRVFKNVDIHDPDSFKKGKSTSEHILMFLRRWYDEILLPENVLAYPGLSISRSVEHAVIWSEIPIIKLEETPTILSVNSIAQQPLQLYNDIEVRIQAWLVARELKCKEVNFQRLSIGPLGGFEQSLVQINEKGHQRTKKMVSDIATLIHRKVNYPSVSDHCNDCPFRRRCII